MRIKFKKKIKTFLLKKGFQIQRYELFNLRNKEFHPLELLQQFSGNGINLLVSIPVEKCRNHLWQTLDAQRNPFVKTLMEYKNSGIKNPVDSALKKYYDNYQPKNAADVMGLVNNKQLKEAPAFAYVLPWQYTDLEKNKKRRLKQHARFNRKRGLEKLDITHSFTNFGPAADEKLAHEFKRLTRLYDNIVTKGYKENPYDPEEVISGSFLIAENNSDWCFMIGGGKHRTYVHAALGEKHIPVMVTIGPDMVKRMQDIPFWKPVKDKLYTIEEAIQICNKIIYCQTK